MIDSLVYIPWNVARKDERVSTALIREAIYASAEAYLLQICEFHLKARRAS